MGDFSCFLYLINGNSQIILGFIKENEAISFWKLKFEGGEALELDWL